MKNRPIPPTTNFFMANKTWKIHPTHAWRFRSAIRAICFCNFEITRVHSIPQDFLPTSLTDLEKTGHSINHCMTLLQKLFQVTVLISLIATSVILAYYCKIIILIFVFLLVYLQREERSKYFLRSFSVVCLLSAKWDPAWEVEIWTCRKWFSICPGHYQFLTGMKKHRHAPNGKGLK